MAGSSPWWDYPRIDNFGTIDPQGNFWKPDTNIQIPGYYPIIAAAPGVVTSVQDTTFGGQVAVTVKLDTPLNSLATHQFYEHMSSATVTVGQHVNQGDLLGYNNPPGSVPLGFGFYSGDVYGSGTAWNALQSDLAPGGAGLLNPVAYVESLSGSSVHNPTSGGSSPATLTGGALSGGALSLLQALPGGIGSVPVIMGILLVAAIGGLVYMIWKET